MVRIARSRLAVLLATLLAAAGARAEVPGGLIRIGVLTDMSGPFASQTGRGSVVAAQMAVEDFAPDAGPLKAEVLSADHQNKPDLGLAIARRWVDQEGVDAIVDLPNSAVGLAVSTLMDERNRTTLASATATSDMTGRLCKATTVQWALDTWALGHAAGRTLTRMGARDWFFISFDYALGQALERDTAQAVIAHGGRVVGSAHHPLGTTDFSAYLLQARASGAQAIGLGDTGTDAVSAIKQMHEFGVIRQGMVLAPLFMQLSDVQAIGLAQAQGLVAAEAFYWDLTPATRAWARRWAERMGGRMPTANHAAAYSATLAYLRAVRQADSVEGARVLEAMRAGPIADPLWGGEVRVRRDGRAVHPMYVFRVKTPAESRGPGDVYALIETIPAEEAFRPLAEGGCPLVGP